jgi:hypothetical protein
MFCMKRMRPVLIAACCAAAIVQQTRAVTVDELGTGPAEIVMIHVDGIGTIPVDAGILKLDVGGLGVDGFCIDPFHFSDGSMSGYHVVELTSAPKGSLMSAGTALSIERLWGSYYSPAMNAADAAGLQIAIWRLIGGSQFSLSSNNDYGAAGFLAAVQAPNYDGPVADLTGLTGPGQDYGVLRQSVNSFVQTVPDTSSTAALLGLAIVTLFIAAFRMKQMSPAPIARHRVERS